MVGSRTHQQEMIRGLAASGIYPVIDHTFALDDIAEAFRLQQSGSHFGKIVLEF
ncbi:MAG: zinc-binding dehydrogenase [Symbiopectobacterium sp.]|uniref:zinc-binding dehydrogenase n=1 Tax=Symbiopectobacterium sp. TaxID=2952789 RepID=UPI0039EC3C66